MEPRSQAEKLMSSRADVSTTGLVVRTEIMGRFPCAGCADLGRVAPFSELGLCAAQLAVEASRLRPFLARVSTCSSPGRVMARSGRPIWPTDGGLGAVI